MKKVYYELLFKLVSPIRIGNGKSEESDSDLMLDGRGVPFIPGTSLAGIFRHYAEDTDRNGISCNRLFGIIKLRDRLFKQAAEISVQNNGCSEDYLKENLKDLISGKEKTLMKQLVTEGILSSTEEKGFRKSIVDEAEMHRIVDDDSNYDSTVVFGDAVLDEEANKDEISFSKRDGVGLNEWGITKTRAKFEFQIAETDKPFRSIVEWTGNEEQYEKEVMGILEPAISHFVAEGMKAGARTSRGYGWLNVSANKKEFTFPDELEEWVQYDPYDQDAFQDAAVIEGKKEKSDCEVEIGFSMISPFSVRIRTAKNEMLEDGSIPDTVPMENSKGNPVIPGTAWAGVFRHHMHALLRDTGTSEKSRETEEVDRLFGYSEELFKIRKSVLSFSETEIQVNDKSVQKNSVVRTAIDRFTAAPRNAALFTSLIYSGGKGTLRISYNRNEVSRNCQELLSACICDMHLGLLSIGGESSVGRGIMKITKLMVNGKDKTEVMMAMACHGSSVNLLMEESENE